MTQNNLSDNYTKYREDFLANVCNTSKEDRLKQQKHNKGIDYFLQRLHTLEEKAQADGLSDELLYEILSYDPEAEENSS